MKEKVKVSGLWLAFEVAALWFTTHVGGGFAMGTQEDQYFVRFGGTSFYLSFISMVVLSIVFYLTWEYQRLYGISDYKEFFDKFFGSWRRVFTSLYDVIIAIVIPLAAGAALAGMSNALSGLLDIKISLYTGYIIAVVIVYLIASFGLKTVLKSSAWMSLGVIGVIVLVIIFRLPQIASNLANVPYKPLLGPTFLQSPFWFMLLYASFQSAAIGPYIAGGSVLKTHRDTVTAAIIGFLLNGIMLFAMCLVIAGDYPSILKEAVPLIYVVNHMSPVFKYLYAFMLLLALITTAVSMVYAGAQRWSRYGTNAKGRWGDEKFRFKVWVIIWLIITYVVSNTGIVRIVKIGYGFLGYASIFVVVLPILILAPAKIARKKKELSESKS